MKKLILILFILTGCMASPMRTPQTITVPSVTIHLYESYQELNEAYTGYLTSVLGFYDGDIHCVKWDFETCGHELYHHIQSTGKLISDDNIHFEGAYLD